MSSERDSVYYPPPPPPPLMPLLLNQFPTSDGLLLSRDCAAVTIPSTVSSNSCTCLKNSENELREARMRLWQQDNTTNTPVISCYRYIHPILQDGPKCGLVALSMASTVSDSFLAVDELFRESLVRGFTNHGEMFSVDNMAVLASVMLQQNCREVEILSGGLGADQNYILQQLNMGSILLIPYDADSNHSPCCRNGHKAHWAVISGVMISQDSENSCHLLARQGKSRQLSVWRYNDLRESNENLLELDPTRAMDGKEYVLPPGGVKAGLCGKAIFLHGLGKIL